MKHKHWLPLIHFKPPHGLINDPNGLIQIGDESHIFFQWNPADCSHKNKHWGLTTTRDWINFTTPKIALAPDRWFNKDGCYSGSSLLVDGQIKVAYTGNVKDNSTRYSYQILADFNQTSGTIENQQIIIDQPPLDYTTHFRDPKLFTVAGHNFITIGAQSKPSQAAVLIYRQGQEKWEYYSSIKLKLPQQAYMFECPDIICISSQQWILIGSPQGMVANQNTLQNRYHCGYMELDKLPTGKEVSASNFRELDYGFEFYAPQTFTNNEQQIILVAWLGMPEEESYHPTSMDNWLYTLSLPRIISWENNHLRQRLLVDKNKICQELSLNWEISNKSKQVRLGHHFWLSCEIDTSYNEPFLINWASDQGNDFSQLTINNNEITWQRNMSLAPQLNGSRKAKFMSQQKLYLEIIQDGAICEIWLNHGEIIMSGYIYANVDSDYLCVSNDETSIKCAKIVKN